MEIFNVAYTLLGLQLLFLLSPTNLVFLPVPAFAIYKAELPLKSWSKTERLSLVFPLLTIVLPLCFAVMFPANGFKPIELFDAPWQYAASYVVLWVWLAGLFYDCVHLVSLRKRCYEVLILASLHVWISTASFSAALFCTEGYWF